MERASGDSEVLQMDWVNGGLPSSTYFFSVLTVILLICHRQTEDTTGTGPGLGHSHYINNWTAPPAPLFPPPHQMNGAMHHTSISDLEPNLFDFTSIPGPLPVSHHQDLDTTTVTLSLPSLAESSDTTSLLPDIDYFTHAEVGTTQVGMAMTWLF
jgi:hypothetical protein